MGFRGKQGNLAVRSGKRLEVVHLPFMYTLCTKVCTRRTFPRGLCRAPEPGIAFPAVRSQKEATPRPSFPPDALWSVTRSRQKPLSSLCKVTRSMTPEISSVAGRRSGIAGFMRCRASFSHERLRAGDLSRSRSRAVRGVQKLRKSLLGHL